MSMKTNRLMKNGLLYLTKKTLCLNLKCEPNKVDFLRNIFEDVKPGYHMNKTHWNTILLDRNMKEDDIFEMVHHSFELTKPKSKNSL